MKRYLAVGYYADNLQKYSTTIEAEDAGEAELKFFREANTNCGYPNGALVALFNVTAATLAGVDTSTDESEGDQVNFGPDFADEDGDEEDVNTKSEPPNIASAMVAEAKPHKIKLVQWREYDDYDESLSVTVIPEGDSRDYCADIASDHDLTYPNEGDQGGDLLVIGEQEIQNGEIMTSPDGRKFRIYITEVTE